ncbi:hypothetical protein [Streptomyces syringium]|uniref:hypothetical protein n=1 Tax=Streptomyces syringium TaxID=76729 RepID=UPI003455A07E
MSVATTALVRMRSRLLSAAYGNTDFRYQLLASWADQALAALAQHSTDDAEQLAARCLQPGCAAMTEDQVLTEAAAAGIATDGWAQQRDRVRSYVRMDYALALAKEPATEAQRMWASLYSHYPAVAAALAEHLAALPETWRQDLFQVDDITRVPAVTSYPNNTLGPETAPCNTDWEDCPACSETQDICRYHAGFQAGEQYIRELLATLATDPIALDQLQERHLGIEHQRATTVAADVFG